MNCAPNYAPIEYWKNRPFTTTEEIQQTQELIEYWTGFLNCVNSGELWGMELDADDIAHHVADGKKQLKKEKNRLRYLKSRKQSEDNTDNFTQCLSEVMQAGRIVADNEKRLSESALITEARKHKAHPEKILVNYAAKNLDLEGYTILLP